ncbi:hypothetical protein FB451DRAFT_36306 [Mycena latifolia]|nr:hypothetical protein FB451DRAFT_36306 [Mycena latifolia]
MRALTNKQNQTGCRIYMDSTIVPAVRAARKLQETDPLVIASEKGAQRTSNDDHIMIVPDWKVSRVPVGAEGQDLDFHGPLDYALVVVDARTYQVIRMNGAAVPPRNNANLLTIVEAKAPLTMEDSRSRIEAQCLALLKDTGRAVFAGVTNGTSWIFFVARAGGETITIYEAPTLYTGHDNDDAPLVVGSLIHLIRHPGTMPDFFE